MSPRAQVEGRASFLEAKTHFLKIHPEWFLEVKQGRKTAELRLDDGRDFKVGDTLVLKEWKVRLKVFTGKSVTKTVTAMTRVCHIIPGTDHRWVVLHMGGPK